MYFTDIDLSLPLINLNSSWRSIFFLLSVSHSIEVTNIADWKLCCSHKKAYFAVIIPPTCQFDSQVSLLSNLCHWELNCNLLRPLHIWALFPPTGIWSRFHQYFYEMIWPCSMICAASPQAYIGHQVVSFLLKHHVHWGVILFSILVSIENGQII